MPNRSSIKPRTKERDQIMRTKHLIIGTDIETGEDVILFTYIFGERLGLQVAERENNANGRKYINLRAVEVA